jgi:hypothetical protein
MNNLIKHKIRILLGLIFVSLLIFLIFRFIIDTKEFKYKYGVELTFSLALKLINNAGTFLDPILLGISILGLLTPRKIGWILTNNMLVYFSTFVIMVIIPTEDNIQIPLILALIALLFYGIMNLKETRDYYKLSKNDLLTFNLIAITTGLGCTLLKGYFILNRTNIYEILY